MVSRHWTRTLQKSAKNTIFTWARFAEKKCPSAPVNAALSRGFDSENQIFRAKLRFNDAEPVAGVDLPLEVQGMTPAHADQIRDFVRKHEHDVDLIVVHCHSGVSRSPAVAAAVSDALHLDARAFWQLYTPNRYVYHTVADAFDREGARGAQSAG